MRIETKLVAAALGAATLWAAPAYAQATRTWVSGVGDDVNPCSRTAPCKTFAGAISKTAASGEINCLDPAGFGTVTITKSITIDCTGTFGSVLNSGAVNGVQINDSATVTPGTIDVRLRGLSINGGGVTPGLNGIRFVSGRSLVVEDVYIQNQRSANGAGILFQPTAAATLVVNNSTVTASGQGTGGGIVIAPTGSGGVRVSLRNVNVNNNTGNGLRVDSSSASGGFVFADVSDSQFSSNTNGVAGAGSGFSARVMLSNSVVSNNSGIGLSASGSSVQMRASGLTISSNGTGVSPVSSGTIYSYGDNLLALNVTDGAFTAPKLTKD